MLWSVFGKDLSLIHPKVNRCGMKQKPPTPLINHLFYIKAVKFKHKKWSRVYHDNWYYNLLKEWGLLGHSQIHPFPSIFIYSGDQNDFYFKGKLKAKLEWCILSVPLVTIFSKILQTKYVSKILQKCFKGKRFKLDISQITVLLLACGLMLPRLF